jgi:hypothetical protein
MVVGCYVIDYLFGYLFPLGTFDWGFNVGLGLELLFQFLSISFY